MCVVQKEGGGRTAWQPCPTSVWLLVRGIGSIAGVHVPGWTQAVSLPQEHTAARRHLLGSVAPSLHLCVLARVVECSVAVHALLCGRGAAQHDVTARRW